MSFKINCFAKTVLAAFCIVLLSKSVALCQQLQIKPDVFWATKHALSSPPIVSPAPGPPRVMQRMWAHPPKITPGQRDSALQTVRGAPVSATTPLGFDGICNVTQTWVILLSKA